VERAAISSRPRRGVSKTVGVDPYRRRSVATERLRGTAEYRRRVLDRDRRGRRCVHMDSQRSTEAVPWICTERVACAPRRRTLVPVVLRRVDLHQVTPAGHIWHRKADGTDDAERRQLV
jgi:hypothetical protein